MDYNTLIAGMKRFGSAEQVIFDTYGYGAAAEYINENVILAPWWEPDILPGLGEARLRSVSGDGKLWTIKGDDLEMTYIKTGVGAPRVLDRLLALGLTRCKRAVFIGSVGALDAGIGIGDIVVPEYSVCGDGASRYLSPDMARDVFGEKAYPDAAMLEKAKAETARLCQKHSVRWHVGRTFSIDTIFAQFAHIGEIVGMGCNSIEMETAAAFRAAGLMGLPLAALFSVSDNTVTSKSLVSVRTPEEMEYRHFVRRELFPEIILPLFR